MLLFSIYCLANTSSFAANECLKNSSQFLEMEEQLASIALTDEIDTSCTGVDKDYVKEIFQTTSAKQALMDFMKQSFCFRKKDGEIVGCHVDKPKRLASISKIFSLSYLFNKYGETDLTLTTTLSDQGDLCLSNDGLANMTEKELQMSLQELTEKNKKLKIKSVCVGTDFLYDSFNTCKEAYTNLMHNQLDYNLYLAKVCSNEALLKTIKSISSKDIQLKRSKCECQGTPQVYSVKLKDRVQDIMARSDSYHIESLFKKFGDEAKLGMKEYLKSINNKEDEFFLEDNVGNSSNNKATCKTVLETPSLKECQSPPLPCGDTRGATFEHLTSFVGGSTKQQVDHEAYYEALDNNFCGKTGSIASQGLKNLVGCFKDSKETKDYPIQAFALFLDGKDTIFLKEMGDHSNVMEDFYQQLLDPKTQAKLIKNAP